MKICLICGHTNEDSLDLCSKCGAVLKKEEIYQPPTLDKNKQEVSKC